MENENQELSVLFLRSFVDTVITSMAIQQAAPEIKIEMPQEQEKLEIVGEYIPSIIEISERKILPTQLIREQQINPLPIHVAPKPILMSQVMVLPIPSHTPFAIPLGKLSPIFSDPGVSSIECLGPGKNVIVHKSGITQTTQVILNQNEIEEILKIISEKTKIPLIKGVFKAALENMIITAVISEFIGTRFHIEKLRIPAVPHIR